MRPDADIAGCTAAHARLLDAIAELGDDDVRRPSLLPDWSIGHVLTHLARNADSHLHMLEALTNHEHLDRAYDEALRAGYLWHEFGDLHLILTSRADVHTSRRSRAACPAATHTRDENSRPSCLRLAATHS